MKGFAFDNRMLIVGSVERMEELQKRQSDLAKEIDTLLEGIEMYIKRTLYTDSKKKDLEASRDKVLNMMKHQENLKVRCVTLRLP